MTLKSEPALERPLSGAAKLALILSAAATILCFYFFALTSILFILALLAFEILLMLALLRLGLAGLITGTMESQGRMLGIFFKSFLIGKGVDFRISLHPEEAPGFFGILKRLCDRLELTVPGEVAVEMNLNAHVRLKGIRQGAGTTILVVGYDLLAGLTEAEVEAVLAHEMAHAKLIRRGLKRWLTGGLIRAANLANGLASLSEAYRRAGHGTAHAEPFVKGAHWFARLAHRLVAAYSRQDEFEADRGAADLCGAAIMRSALIKVESLGNVAARLPWRERVARHHSAEGFSRWLVKELATDDSTQPPGDAPDPSNKYSTHPLLRDRLAALPLAVVSASGAVDRTGSGIDLLAAPDTVAAKLIAEIEKLVLDEEQKDRKQLKRWLQKARSARQMRPLQVFGVLLVLFGVVGGGGFWLFNHLSPGLAAFVLFFAGSGVLLHRKGRYREGLSLPVPDYSLLKRSWDEARETEDVREVQKRVESELTALVASERKARKKASILAARSFEALAQCDYLRAHVAGRMCRALDDKSVDGALGLAIAAAALHQGQQAASVLGLVQRSTGFSTPPSLWGGAWVFLLSGDWARAEALLEGAVEQAPGEPTLVTLLALCQSRRGKLQSAIVTARKACSPKPRNKEHAKLLIGLLLDAGYVAEAKARLLKLEPELRSDTDLIIAMVRLNVMQGNFDAAEEWTRLLKQVAAGANSLITVGEHYEVARRPDDAAVFYQQAMLLGHYPDALLGLARLEASRQNKDQARKHIFSAVDVKKPLGSKALGPIPLFHRIIVQLLALQDPVPGCRAWTATLTASTPEALINKTLLIYAAGTSEADGYLQSLLRAMQPGSPPVLPGTILWREARGEQQPEGSARPGIQCVLN